MSKKLRIKGGREENKTYVFIKMRLKSKGGEKKEEKELKLLIRLRSAAGKPTFQTEKLRHMRKCLRKKK